MQAKSLRVGQSMFLRVGYERESTISSGSLRQLKLQTKKSTTMRRATQVTAEWEPHLQPRLSVMTQFQLLT
jgi:hypothetical protein